MRSGMTFLSSEINRFDIVRIAVVDSPIPTAFVTEVVVASVGHMPSTSMNTGFSK